MSYAGKDVYYFQFAALLKVCAVIQSCVCNFFLQIWKLLDVCLNMFHLFCRNKCVHDYNTCFPTLINKLF